MKLKNIKIPKYTLGEEITSSVSHGIGALLSIAALVLLIVYSALHHNTLSIISSIIYGTSLIILYVMSTIYHSLKVNKGKKVFRVLDHSSIYLLIAGTYTPFTLIVLHGKIGWILFSIIWISAIIGIILNSININKYKVISFLLYLLMGWAVIFAFKPLMQSLEKNGFILLLIGGIVYTLGSITYLLGSKYKYIHSVFHIFVLLGSILHFFSIFFYVI